MLKQVLLVQRQTSGLHRSAWLHWRLANFLLVAIAAVVAFMQYNFYQRVNNEAFSSAAEVQPVGTRNIDAELLLDVLVDERGRSVEFVSSIESGPVSFDPSRYDIVLRVGGTDDNQEESATTTKEVE